MGGEHDDLAWIKLWASLKFRDATGLDDDHGDCLAVENITSRGGTLINVGRHSANDKDLAAALLIWVFIYAWTCVIYRANLRVFDKNGAVFLQNDAAAFSTLIFSASLAVQWLHETRRLFLVADTLCQMNRPLTFRMSALYV